jgi:hypothetical protein
MSAGKRVPILYIISTIIVAIFLYCGKFSIPSADDYFYANFVKDHGLIGAQIQYYVGWSGRYVATFLITLFSLTGYEHYWLTPIICILSVLFSFQFFIKTIFHDIRNQLDLRLLPLAFIALYLSVTIAGYGHGVAVINEGYFWFSGAITYAGSLALYLLLLSSFIWMLRGVHAHLNYLVSLVLAALVIGLSETVMFLVVLTVSPLILWYWRRMGNLKSIALLLVILCCSLIVFLAPGNDVRMGTSDGGSILSALGICVEKIVQIFFYFIFNPFVWLFVIALKNELNFAVTYITENFNLKIVNLFGGILVYFLYLPVAYSLNAGAPDRLIAFIGFFALIMSVLYIYALYQWLLTKITQRSILFVLLPMLIAGGYFFVEPLRIATASIVTGPSFYRQHQIRNQHVRDESLKGNAIVEVEYIKRNKLLLFEDLIPNDNNEQYARFYGAKSVRVSDPKPE